MTVKELIGNFYYTCKYQISDFKKEIEGIFTLGEIINNNWLEREIKYWKYDYVCNKLYIHLKEVLE